MSVDYPGWSVGMQHFIVPNQKLNQKKENKMDSTNKIIVAALVALVITILMGLLLAFPVMVVWNSFLVPALTIVKPIGWIQAWGIMVLCGVLFKADSFSLTNK